MFELARRVLTTQLTLRVVARSMCWVLGGNASSLAGPDTLNGVDGDGIDYPSIYINHDLIVQRLYGSI